ncbi:MAG: XTP/dITP diphosphatase [Cetobacterium sp.]|uniref:XTP/dITP diphosphatase n=1 Tax=unclassified Cetobacterium TaxID=2630983 RepID=UPI00163B6AC1|nr:XTP/dITP diphosphatase [Cetobacterium sp. 2A]MBC2856538.1 XTP/dITP diphosphatase [Cetobacterium sp. 2A]
MKIFLATGNKKKINEITKNLDGNLDGNKYEILSINDGIEIPEVVEDGDTFEANSQKKALEIAKFTGMVTIADDSGLCVDALNGAPGIYSARYSGEDATDEKNNELLIKNLSGIENRAAKFVCVISLAKPNGEVYSFRGEYEGEIIDTPRGGVGFGYDPYFYVKEYGKTFAEMPEIKVKVSHRARALEKLKLGIENILKNC